MVRTMLTSSLGITAVQAVAEIPNTNQSIEIGKLLVQIIIGIATIIKLWKKKKEQ